MPELGGLPDGRRRIVAFEEREAEPGEEGPCRLGEQPEALHSFSGGRAHHPRYEVRTDAPTASVAVGLALRKVGD